MMVDESHIVHMAPDESRVVPMMEPPLTQEEEWIKDVLEKTRQFNSSRDLLVVPSAISDKIHGIPLIALTDLRNVAKVTVGSR